MTCNTLTLRWALSSDSGVGVLLLFNFLSQDTAIRLLVSFAEFGELVKVMLLCMVSENLFFIVLCLPQK